MFKKRIKFNVDKLKLSYDQPQELFEELKKYPKNKYLDFNDFFLYINDDGRSDKSKKEPSFIIAELRINDPTSDEEILEELETIIEPEQDTEREEKRKGLLLGEFTFNNSAKFDGVCFFKFSNEALYTPQGYANKEKYNRQVQIEYVADMLGLTLRTQTELELACDINFNPIPKIRKMIADYENYDMVYNGKRIIDENRKIKDYGEIRGRSRKRIDAIPTLYFGQAASDGLQMKIYDKSREIKEENPQKTYIEKWNDFGNRPTYRLEITIRWEQFKKWWAALAADDSQWGRHNHKDPEKAEPVADYLGRSEGFLMDEAYKSQLWAFCAFRLLHFRSKTSHKVVSLLDIARGTAD